MLYCAIALAIALGMVEYLGTRGELLAGTAGASAAGVVAIRTIAGATATFLWLAPMVLVARALTRTLGDSTSRFPIQVALGLGIGFTLTHLLAWLGAFSPAARGITLIAWSIGDGIALVALGHKLVSAWRSGAIQKHIDTVSPQYFLAVPPLVILFMAASQPPGWLWGSEIGGFDSLSYHLQLPQEWLAAGRLNPVDHNVYSYLPSYVEAVFMQFGAAAESMNSAGANERQHGLLALHGLPLFVCQHFHAWCAVIAGWLTARCVAKLAGNADFSGLTFAAVLSIPWVVITGSLSYNECAVLALMAGGLLIAADQALQAGTRCAIAAFLIGVSCGCKPTALLFCVAPVALILLRDVPFRSYGKLAAIAAGVGLVTISPWLIRNTLAAGNPVFPQLDSLFGMSHWTREQLDRYALAHSFSGSFADRFKLLFSSDRGLFHPQFALTGLGLLLLVGLTLRKATQKNGVLLALGLLSQIAAWLIATHLQSRFLIPLVIPLSIVVGLCAATLPARRITTAILAVLVFSQGVLGISIYLSQRQPSPGAGGNPNLFLFAGPEYFTGELFREALNEMQENERGKWISEINDPAAYLNLTNTIPTSVLLIGDATPLYFGAVRYSTTWDSSPLKVDERSSAGGIFKSPEQLRAMGIYYVLVNFSELSRYCKSQWNDPRFTPEIITEWLQVHAVAKMGWKQTGIVLFELNESSLPLPGPPG